MEFEGREKFELLQNADLPTMLQNMDTFQGSISQALREKFSELFGLGQEEARVELSPEEVNALADWLEIDFEKVLDKHKAAIDFLRTDEKAETEEQIKMMLDLEKSINTQQSYWGEKHRGKRFVYTLIKKLINQK